MTAWVSPKGQVSLQEAKKQEKGVPGRKWHVCRAARKDSNSQASPNKLVGELGIVPSLGSEWFFFSGPEPQPFLCQPHWAQGTVSQTSRGWYVTSYSAKKGFHFQISLGNGGSKLGFFFTGVGGCFFFSAGPLRDFTMLKCIVTLQERVRGWSLLTMEPFFSKKYLVSTVENNLAGSQKIKYTITIWSSNSILIYILERIENWDWKQIHVHQCS